jgi:hypothetical protein
MRIGVHTRPSSLAFSSQVTEAVVDPADQLAVRPVEPGAGSAVEFDPATVASVTRHVSE